MDKIRETLNEVLVKLFREIITIEEKAIRVGEFRDLTVNDMHVIDVIEIGESKNMTTVAKALSVTTGTLTIAINGLVNKGYVKRERSDQDRRVVLISLTEKGIRAFNHHAAFHTHMIDAVMDGLDADEQVILGHALGNLNTFFYSIEDVRRLERFPKSEGPESK